MTKRMGLMKRVILMMCSFVSVIASAHAGEPIDKAQGGPIDKASATARASASAKATADKTADTQGRPVKVYILAGQSNMTTMRRDSRGVMNKAYPDVSLPLENVWFMDGGDLGRVPLGQWGVETPFVMELVRSIDEPVLLFKSAQGNTSLFNDWRPPSAVKRDGGTVGALYNRMIRRFHNMIRNVQTICPPTQERGYEVAGFIWFQGEKDSENAKAWASYESNLRDLIADVRRDVGVPNLPFLIIQINNIPLWDGTPDKPKGGAKVRDAQKKVAEEDPKGRWISTSSLSQDYHYDNASYLTIGKRMAEAMLPLAKEVVPTDSAQVKAAGEVFWQLNFPDTQPDVSSLKKGLIFYLPFEDADATNITDRINGIKGKVFGEATLCDGMFGKGFRMPAGRWGDGRVEFADFKDPVQDGLIKTMSVSFWLQAPSVTVGDVISKSTRDKSKEYHRLKGDGWKVSVSSLGDITSLSFNQDDGAEAAPSPVSIKRHGPQPWGDGIEWHHVVAVYDNPGKTLAVYVDAAGGVAYNDWNDKLSGRGIVPATGAPLSINGFKQAVDRTTLDEVAIWKRALTFEEIKALYNNSLGVSLTEGAR